MGWGYPSHKKEEGSGHNRQPPKLRQTKRATATPCNPRRAGATSLAQSQLCHSSAAPNKQGARILGATSPPRHLVYLARGGPCAIVPEADSRKPQCDAQFWPWDGGPLDPWPNGGYSAWRRDGPPRFGTPFRLPSSADLSQFILRLNSKRPLIRGAAASACHSWRFRLPHLFGLLHTDTKVHQRTCGLK